MTSKSNIDSATYAEVQDVTNEAFEMDRNRCYTTVNNSTKSGEKSSLNRQGCFIAISVLLSVLMLVVVATSVCVIFALVKISKLEADIASLSAIKEFCGENVHEEIPDLRKNHSQLLEIVNNLDGNVEELLQNYSQIYPQVQQLKVETRCLSLITACSDLVPSCPSGYYWVRASNGSVVRVYCDMTLSCGNITGGWMRVAELNMTDTSQQCPNSLVERTDGNIRSCCLTNTGCSPTTYSTQTYDYTKVCGRITAYQVGTTNAFLPFIRFPGTPTINSCYVDGISITHGNSRQHIWTFAAALDRNGSHVASDSYCPCQDTTYLKPAMIVPPFVGEDYFCDASNEVFMTGETGLQTNPLWDGTDCLCCDNPPWFYKQLPQPTTDDIEMRVCRTEISENIAIEVVNIYIQ